MLINVVPVAGDQFIAVRIRQCVSSRDDVFCDLYRELSNAGTSKLLNKPSCGGVDGVLVQARRR